MQSITLISSINTSTTPGHSDSTNLPSSALIGSLIVQAYTPATRLFRILHLCINYAERLIAFPFNGSRLPMRIGRHRGPYELYKLGMRAFKPLNV